MEVEPNELTVAVEEMGSVMKQILAAVPSFVPKDRTEVVVAFVGACPSPIEVARREPFISDNGIAIRKQYLEPLGLQRDDVALLNAVPIVLKSDDGRARPPSLGEIGYWRDQLIQELDEIKPEFVIALGNIAKEALGDRADFVMPHPAALRKFGDSGEVARKIRRVKDAISKRKNKLDAKSLNGEYLTQSASDDDHVRLIDKPKEQTIDLEKTSVPILKADEDKRIIYGVVLDPYQVDAHGDYISPAEIEQTAHKWMQKSRFISLNHRGEANAVPVESWIEQYPNRQDYKAAIDGKPHKAFRREFGVDVIHSGAWVLGTQLDDDLWQKFKNGDIQAYSIEGFCRKSSATLDTMPEVKFIDLIAVAPRKSS
jgi:uracil-DNA glycosylase family 4